MSIADYVVSDARDGKKQSEVTVTLRLKTSDAKLKQYTYEVYTPFDPNDPALDQIDNHGEFMLPSHLTKLAHDFISNCRVVKIDHQGEDQFVDVVESWINDDRVQSPNFYPNAWVITLSAARAPDIAEKIENGELPAVSFSALVHEQEVRIPSAEIPDDPYGGKYDHTLAAV